MAPRTTIPSSQRDIAPRKFVSGLIGATKLTFGTWGVILWDLFYDCGPFDSPPDAHGPGSAEEFHLGQVISLLGPLPSDLLDRGKESSRYFDTKGQFKSPELIGQKDLVSMANQIDDDSEIPQCVDFISRMLRWMPEDRSTAEDLLSHPWLPQTRPTNG